MVRGQWMPGLRPYSFFERHPGIFNDHRESPWFNQGSSKGCCFLQYSVPHRPQGEHPLLVSLTPLPAATWFSQEVSYPGTDQAQPCLASVGHQSWATDWYSCWKVSRWIMYSIDLFKNTDSFSNKTNNFLSQSLNHLFNRFIQSDLFRNKASGCCVWNHLHLLIYSGAKQALMQWHPNDHLLNIQLLVWIVI